ncbi:MAG: HEPN domain-containing protein [Candidatus Lokiarchaeia archaeon]
MVKLARSYINQASARVKDASEALEEKNYPYAVRLSQEAVELSLKAVLRLVAIEYPKIHDLSEILTKVQDRFPQWFSKEVPFMAEASMSLAKKREISFYGEETEALTPDELIDKSDAEDAVQKAEKTLKICQKLLQEYEKQNPP